MQAEHTHLKIHTHLSPCRFGFAFGLWWGIGWFLLGLAGWKFAYGLPMITVMSSVYFGYAPTLLGSIYGGLCGFVDGLIFAVLVAWTYNCCGCCPHKCKRPEETPKI